MRGRTAIAALRCLTVGAMVFGLSTACYGFLNKFTIALFAFDVPSWIVGVSAAYMGLRFWRRIPELEKKIDPNAKFSFKNFSIGRSKARASRAS